jgi:hypothetical protein
MHLESVWPKVRECIVGISPIFSGLQHDFPQFVGTGFLASPHGVVCTCRHVAEAFEGFPKPPDFQGIPAVVSIFRQHPTIPAWGFMALRVMKVGSAAIKGDITAYAGPRPADVAYLILDVTDTPYLEIGNAPVLEGEPVGIGGFPMGTDLLRAPGWLHQITPTVLSGVVSAVLPHHAHPTPHGLLIDAHTLGGSSGSPVFRPDGSVIGMVHAGITNPEMIDSGRAVIVRHPTSLALCVARDIIAGGIAGAEADAERLSPRMRLPERIALATTKARTLGDPVFDAWTGREGD